MKRIVKSRHKADTNIKDEDQHELNVELNRKACGREFGMIINSIAVVILKQ